MVSFPNAICYLIEFFINYSLKDICPKSDSDVDTPYLLKRKMIPDSIKENTQSGSIPVQTERCHEDLTLRFDGISIRSAF